MMRSALKIAIRERYISPDFKIKPKLSTILNGALYGLLFDVSDRNRGPY
jgi:hypothetical protein